MLSSINTVHRYYQVRLPTRYTNRSHLDPSRWFQIKSTTAKNVFRVNNKGILFLLPKVLQKFKV